MAGSATGNLRLPEQGELPELPQQAPVHIGHRPTWCYGRTQLLFAADESVHALVLWCHSRSPFWNVLERSGFLTRNRGGPRSFRDWACYWSYFLLYWWFQQHGRVSQIRASSRRGRRYPYLSFGVFPSCGKHLQSDDPSHRGICWCIVLMRRMIRETVLDRIKPSLANATQWYDNMTLYLDALLSMQDKLSIIILDSLESVQTNSEQTIMTVAILFVIVSLMCPLILNAVYSLTAEIHGYSITLADR